MTNTMITKAYRTMGEAHANANRAAGTAAITVDGHNVVLPLDFIIRLEQAGKSFAYISLCAGTGTYMTIPVN